MKKSKTNKPPVVAAIIVFLILAAAWVATIWHYDGRVRELKAAIAEKDQIIAEATGTAPAAAPVAPAAPQQPAEETTQLPTPVTPPATPEEPPPQVQSQPEVTQAQAPVAPTPAPPPEPAPAAPHKKISKHVPESAAETHASVAQEQRVRGPERHLSPEQENNLGAGLAAAADRLSKVNIYVGAAPDAEARHYAKEVADILAQSGIKVMGVVTGADGRGPGFYVKVSDTANPPKEAIVLLEAIRDAGFEVSLAPWENEDADAHSVELYVGAD